MHYPKNVHSDKLSRQLFVYGIVGGLAFVADYGSLWVLTEYCHLHYLVSAALAFIIGLMVNYILSTAWVFTERRYNNIILEIILFSIIGIIGLLFNELLIYFIVEFLSMHYMFGKIVSTIVVFFWNFFARKYLLFHKK